MSVQELLAEIQKLPPEEQRRLLEALSRSIGQPSEPRPAISEDEVNRILFERESSATFLTRPPTLTRTMILSLWE